MRIIAGKYKGLRLHAPRDSSVRPVMDGVKEYIFNVIQAFVPGARVCDIFAGTGGIGLEALSRGAAAVVLVERSRAAAAVIERNLDVLHRPAEVTVALRDAREYVQSCGDSFDIVFCDPPYDYPHGAEVASTAVGRGLVRPGGLFVMEHVDCSAELAAIPGVEVFRERKFGRTVITMLRVQS